MVAAAGPGFHVVLARGGVGNNTHLKQHGLINSEIDMIYFDYASVVTAFVLLLLIIAGAFPW